MIACNYNVKTTTLSWLIASLRCRCTCFGTKKETLEQLHFHHLVDPQGVYNTCRMLCFYMKTFQTSYHFVFIFKHFVSLVVSVLSLTRLTKLSVQLCCVSVQKCFVSLSGNQLKISDVCKILFHFLCLSRLKRYIYFAVQKTVGENVGQ